MVTQSFMGTCVNVKNAGTFVSYGGKYIGYGMTPNIRNAVVECTKNSKVYIYDGLFEGRCGANIFNIVKAGSDSHDHHFKWWFDIGPIRAIILAHLKGGHRKHITGNL